MSSSLKLPITEIKGIGEKTSKLFAKCGVFTIEDLLRYYPRAYDVFEKISPIMCTKSGERAAVKAFVCSEASVRYIKGKNILSFKAADESGILTITYFNAPYLKKSIKNGCQYIFRGVINKAADTVTMVQPGMYSADEYKTLSSSMKPVYPLTEGLGNTTVSKAVASAFRYIDGLKETLPRYILEKEGFLGIKEAVKGMHFPEDKDLFMESRRRIVFEEFYDFILKLKRLKTEDNKIPNTHPMKKSTHSEDLLNKLPYELTSAQLRVWEEIRKDLGGAYVMNRLIQGDVGSGKTIVALLALIMCAENGFQGAIMAPTSVLAKQHYESFISMAEEFDLPIKPVLLTGSLKAGEKRKVYELIASGEKNLIVGTQALFQEKAVYKNLALVVTDEQHRFGVRQRDNLAYKGRDAHVLSMSATPIPRSLAIILYGDVSVSLLDRMPSNRKPVKNAVVNDSCRTKAWQLVLKELAAGHQAYIICPMIEKEDVEAKNFYMADSKADMSDLKNVKDYALDIRKVFPDNIVVDVLHGKMKPDEKDRIMEAFSQKKIDVLIATTVVEVGVNVPNATVMIVEDAQRFGLAQLHQLRGRVGRGDAQSYCIFIDTSEAAAEGKISRRLNVMKKSNNGFEIAEEDLRQRGPGELFGIRQSGEIAFAVADIYSDADLLTKAASYAGACADEVRISPLLS